VQLRPLATVLATILATIFDAHEHARQHAREALKSLRPTGLTSQHPV